MIEFKFDVKGTKHKIVIIAEDEKKAKEIHYENFGKKDDD